MALDFQTLRPIIYCNHTKFCTRFNFVYFVLLAGSTKFSSIRKPYTYTSVSDTTVAVRKFLAYESWQTLEYEIFTRTKISAITVVFSNTSTTKRLRRWSFWYDKWFCSFKNLSRVLPSFRSNGKVGFDGGGGARDLCRVPACAEEWLQTDSVY